MFDALNITSTALSAESLRLDLVANNLANATTTKTVTGFPYQSESAILSAVPAPRRGAYEGVGQGVMVRAIVSSPAPFPKVYDPTSPLANHQGYILQSNVNLSTQMVDMAEASQAYQANANAFSADKNMILKALTLGA
ncbi:MAG: flagellar basal body rod protein FlgC [Firmicutes bacterium]|jgi:flagellar basal-body rod protein FlgC|uniref:Flagellar basal-body rod protein FlgC n=1 Tax=Sulfobacillus benefaciens TaxID=453960 RepID=A0A2T2X6I1_9FIRM|nr:flagellar basal body rod protein FlgC [Bacillota bacterium]MCL5015684.1 flagellar basal body rod protein FlgC [Bacillota bacterium]PSR30110.1 MAG: flagellar basal body rod protein FlgC [Sulfobacillus benefaciens]HBQ94680.1 flagellar basal body rod protein FlgC [Sulfobacillus sp.]